MDYSWIHILAILGGALLILHGVLKIFSVRYYRAVYEIPLLGDLTSSDKRHQANSYGWWRYAMTIKEFGLGALLIAWGTGILNLSV